MAKSHTIVITHNHSSDSDNEDSNTVSSNTRSYVWLKEHGNDSKWDYHYRSTCRERTVGRIRRIISAAGLAYRIADPRFPDGSLFTIPKMPGLHAYITLPTLSKEERDSLEFIISTKLTRLGYYQRWGDSAARKFWDIERTRLVMKEYVFSPHMISAILYIAHYLKPQLTDKEFVNNFRSRAAEWCLTNRKVKGTQTQIMMALYFLMVSRDRNNIDGRMMYFQEDSDCNGASSYTAKLLIKDPAEALKYTKFLQEFEKELGGMRDNSLLATYLGSKAFQIMRNQVFINKSKKFLTEPVKDLINRINLHEDIKETSEREII